MTRRAAQSRACRPRRRRNLARLRRKMAGLHDIRDVIEPASGAARKASDGNRGGVHTMWQSDEYRNVWWCVPLDGLGHKGVKDAASIDTARKLLQRLKRHSDPVLRHYGWTVKHLKEHVGGPGGMCYHDNQGTADISLQLRTRPDKQCNSFRNFHQLMGVMIHEMTHISGLGLEDIHPPEFFEKMREVRGVYRKLLAEGAMDADDEATDSGGDAAADGAGDSVEGGCKARKGRGGRANKRKRRRPGASGATGAAGSSSSAAAAGPKPKRRALGKKKSMIDRRNREGKRLAAEQAARTPAENARMAALARFGQAPLSAKELAVQKLRTKGGSDDCAIELLSDDDDDDEDDGGLFAPMGPMPGEEDSDEEEEGEEEEEDDDVEIHNGPPGHCDCAKCRPALVVD